jgi:hypothetical protein
MSTTEAEYVAALNAAKEALWLGRLARTFQQCNSEWIPTVFSDSQGVVALAKNLVHHNVSKHIEVWYHFVRDCATKEMLSLEKITTIDNVADAMTKSLSTDRFTCSPARSCSPVLTCALLLTSAHLDLAAASVVVVGGGRAAAPPTKNPLLQVDFQ